MANRKVYKMRWFNDRKRKALFIIKKSGCISEMFKYFGDRRYYRVAVFLERLENEQYYYATENGKELILTEKGIQYLKP